MRTVFNKSRSIHNWILVVMLMLLGACTNDDYNEVEIPDNGAEWTMPSSISVGLSKETSTRISYQDDNTSGVKLLWQTGDQFTLYNTSGESVTYTLTSGAGDTKAIFNLDGTTQLTGSSFYAVYKNGSNIEVTFSGGVPSYNLSVTGQNQTKDTGINHLKGVDLIVAEITKPNQLISFSSQGTLLTFQLSNIPTEIGTPENLLLLATSYTTGTSINVFRSNYNSSVTSTSFQLDLSGYSAGENINAYIMLPPFSIPAASNLTVILNGSTDMKQYVGNIVNEKSYLAAKQYTFAVDSWQDATASIIYTIEMDNYVQNNNDDTFWSGVKPAGAGTETNPYLIQTAWQLAWVKKFLPTTATYYNLQTNIICEDGLSWLPIGRAPNTSAFTGTFNGNGHTI